MTKLTPILSKYTSLCVAYMSVENALAYLTAH